MAKVILYTTPACPYCYTLKSFFKENNIDFEEIDVSHNEKAKEDLIERTGKIEVPVVDIDGQTIIGFDKEKISKLLKIE